MPPGADRPFCRRLGRGLWICAAILCAGGPARAADPAPGTVSGRVFLDRNGNGRPDPDERGLPGIRVTDGVEFAVTDATGAYTLTLGADYMIPYRPARTVSVCWPSGQWPTGRWWRRLSEITDARAVHFGLRDDAQARPFVFLQTSDDHGSGSMYAEHYALDARRMQPAARFLFNTGDMGYATPAGADQMFRAIAGHAAAFPLPMFSVPGNHDFVGENKDLRLDSHPLAGWGAFTLYLGPVRWSFDYAGVHFLGLDYMERTARGFADRIPHVAVRFMEKDLAGVRPGTRVVLLVHCYAADADFFRALHRFKVELLCCGHTHMPGYARVGRVPAITNYGVGTGIVTDGAMDIAERRPLSFGPSLLLGYFDAVTKVAMERRRRDHRAVADRVLNNATLALPGSPPAESVEIEAEIVPGAAGRVGFRAGAQAAVEITFDGTSVNVAGAPVPFALLPEELVLPPAAGAPAGAPGRKIPADRSLRWHLLLDRDRLTILGNNLFRLTKAVKVGQPAAITLLAAGSPAAFKHFDVWELRPIRNPASRGLHHFAPPAWKWGTFQHVAACLDDGSPTAADILRRYSADGVMDYDME